MTTETAGGLVTELNGRKIAFPAVRSFAELFPEVRAHDPKAGNLAEWPSWEAGTWSDRGRRTRSYLGSYLYVSGPDGGHRSFTVVTTAPDLIPWVEANMILGPWDTKHFDVHVWNDGRALVCCTYGQIVGSHYLAVIDAATIPAKL